MNDETRPVEVATPFPGGNWCLPPPVPGCWRDLSESEATLLVARMWESIGPFVYLEHLLPLAVEAIRIWPASFYDGWLLCDFQVRPNPSDETLQPDQPATRLRPPPFERAILSYLYGPDGFLPLDGNSTPIHIHNHSHGVDLSTDEKRRDYLRFFCFAVHGEHGPFRISETPSAIDLSGAKLDAEKRAEVECALAPITADLETEVPAETFVYRACVFYGDALFRAKFAITSDAQVQMLDDDPLVEHVRGSPGVGYAGNARISNPSPKQDTSP